MPECNASDALRNAQRQSRFRQRRDERLSELDRQARSIIDALSDACERGRCPALTNHLPDPPQAGLAELVARLQSRRLIVCKNEPDKYYPGDFVSLQEENQCPTHNE